MGEEEGEEEEKGIRRERGISLSKKRGEGEEM